MAIIYSYPEKTTPAGGDFLVITDSEQPAPNKNRTKSLTIDNLANYVVTSTSGITGSGTLNTIAMFTPSGQAIGDSIITQASLGQGVTISGVLDVVDDLNVTGSIETNSSLTVQSTSTFNDDATFENAVNINDALYDQNSSSGTAGQVLSSTGTGNIEWIDSDDVVSGAVAKLIPFQVTASAGGSSAYNADNNIVEFSWTGGNGTYTLFLPTATGDNQYRNIRFVTNSTFPNGASDKVRITALPGETIDGDQFFEISKVYEGISVWSNGTEWIIIQAKAH